MLDVRLARFISALRCPVCRSPLEEEGINTLVCTGDSHRFKVHDGCPTLLSDVGEALQKDEYPKEGGCTTASADDTLSGWKAQLENALHPPSISCHRDPLMERSPASKLFTDSISLVLNIGGGPNRYRPMEIVLNLVRFDNVDLVADAHNLPFHNGSVDAVICNAVLEHTRNHEHVMSEIFRVLRPSGQLYVEVPFIYYEHGYPNDYRRFTLTGLKNLFSDYEDTEYGITEGPVSAQLQLGNILLQSLIPSRYRLSRMFISGVYKWLLFPLKYLDQYTCNLPDARLLCAGFYAYGRKPAGPASGSS